MPTSRNRRNPLASSLPRHVLKKQQRGRAFPIEHPIRAEVFEFGQNCLISSRLVRGTIQRRFTGRRNTERSHFLPVDRSSCHWSPIANLPWRGLIRMRTGCSTRPIRASNRSPIALMPSAQVERGLAPSSLANQATGLPRKSQRSPLPIRRPDAPHAGIDKSDGVATNASSGGPIQKPVGVVPFKGTCARLKLRVLWNAYWAAI